MKILLSWLKDYVQINKDPAQLAEDLSMFAHEVESIKEFDKDALFDLEITPNRGDCLSHLGIARQVAAMYSLSLNVPEIKLNETKVNKTIHIEVEKQSICPRFTARIIDNIKIKESPKWLQNRLIAYGFRPINNIVDITNYVMVATGQPLHAFDYDKIKNGKMHIRLSKNNEKIMTLDGKERKLPKEAIIIEDDNGIFDLTGIMGGQNSEVDEKTKTIILQGAIFDPILIRRASKKLHHQTDASYRYERGVDYDGTIYGVDFASSLMKETDKNIIIGQLIDQKQVQETDQKISFSYDRINRLLGINLESALIDSFLTRLHFKMENSVATVPSFRRFDVQIWQDLAEEVARVYGYNNIKRSKPKEEKNSTENTEYIQRELLKDYLKEKGFTEVYSTSFATKDKIEVLGINLEDCAQIINPIAPETQYLRPNLSVSLLAAAAKNPWAPELNIFEIEKVFNFKSETWQVGILTTTKNAKLLNEILNELEVNESIKQVEQKVLDVFKIRKPISIVAFDIDQMKKSIDAKIDYKISENRMREISRFAPTIRDISIVVGTEIESEEIEKTIREASSGVLLTEKFDEFMSDKFGKNKKSLAFHVWLQNEKSVVSEEEANKIIKDIIKDLEYYYQAKLRA